MQEQPPGHCILEVSESENKTYIKFSNYYVTTKNTGQRKYVKGTNEAAQKRATRWAWKFYEGWFREDYEVK